MSYILGAIAIGVSSFLIGYGIGRKRGMDRCEEMFNESLRNLVNREQFKADTVNSLKRSLKEAAERLNSTERR
jgi:hypothetical protein